MFFQGFFVISSESFESFKNSKVRSGLSVKIAPISVCQSRIIRTPPKRRYFRALCRIHLSPYSKYEQSRAGVLLYVARDSGYRPGFVNFINYLILKPCVFEPICVILILVYSLLIYNCCAPMRLHALACVHCDTFIYKPCVLNGR